MQLHRIQCSVKIILLRFTDCALPEWQRTELWPLRPKASGPSPPAVPDAAQNKDVRRKDQTKWEFFFPQLPQKISGLYRVSRFLLFHFLSCWAPLSKSTEVSYQPSFIQKLIKMILGKKDRKDCKCTVHSYLIFVISFTLAGFSKTKFYTQKND